MISTVAPSSSKVFFIASASSFLTFSLIGFGDEVSAAKILSKFIKDNKKGEITGAVLEGKVLDAKEAQKLASMPSREELYAKMLGCINSPATGIAGCVNGVMSALVRALDQVRQQKSA